jgi:hypothetical protein
MRGAMYLRKIQIPTCVQEQLIFFFFHSSTGTDALCLLLSVSGAATVATGSCGGPQLGKQRGHYVIERPLCQDRAAQF